MQALPPTNTVGTTKGVGDALGVLFGRPAPEADPLQESTVLNVAARDSTTLGALRAATAPPPAPPSVDEDDDGTPDMAWDPATRFAGSPEPSPRPRAAPTPPEPVPTPQALTQPLTQLAESQLPPSCRAPSMAALVRGAMKGR